MHKLLERQLRRHLSKAGDDLPEPWRSLLRDVDAAYRGADDDRLLLERSLDLTSQELVSRNRQLRQDIQERLRDKEALAASEQRLALHLEHTPLGAIEWNAQLEIVAWNAAAERIFGLPRERALGQSIALLVPDAQRAREVSRFGELLESRGASRCTRECRTTDGRVIVCEWTDTSLVSSDGRFCGVASLVQDVTERVLADRRLRQSEERYALAVRGANDGLWDWDLLAGTLYFSPRWKQMLGCPDRELSPVADEWFSRVHPDDLAPLRAALDAHLSGRTEHFEHEHRMRHADGSWRWMLSHGNAVRAPDGSAVRLAGSQTDITERKRAEEQLLHDALHDSLTGLPNRALFLELLRRAIARAQRSADYRFAVLFLDLDRFKMVNDGLGHMLGDELLTQIARRLEGCLRGSDVLARHGGDEFTLFLDGVSGAPEASKVAERIHEVLKAPFNLDGQEVFSSASIGLAVGSGSYTGPEEVLRDADTAMYRAKALGKARHVVFDATMHTLALQQLQLENDLRRALERGELRIQYQPIVFLPTGRVVGLEALSRWTHPQRGEISPTQFIPVAEETGIIVPLGRWVMAEATRQLAHWKKIYSGPLYVSVNLSGRQLLQPGLVEMILGYVRDAGISPRDLKLEVTESSLVENFDAAAALLAELHAQQMEIYLDDFGTGYSSLSYLHRFQVDALKIDRSFVAGLNGVGNAEIVRAVLTLGRNLGKSVIAEGVETAEQLVFLRALECTSAQGYYFAKPLDPEEVPGVLGVPLKR